MRGRNHLLTVLCGVGWQRRRLARQRLIRDHTGDSHRITPPIHQEAPVLKVASKLLFCKLRVLDHDFNIVRGHHRFRFERLPVGAILLGAVIIGVRKTSAKLAHDTVPAAE
jgi:hypothetical protein